MALGISLLGGAGCAEVPRADEANRQRNELLALIQELLDERAGQLAARDADAYLEPLDPEARRNELPIAQGFLKVPARDPSFVVQASSLTGSSRRAEVRTRFQYRYEGLPDDNPFSFPIAYRFRSEQGALRIAESDPGPDQLPIWAGGDVRQHQSTHFLALARPQVSGVEALLATAEGARAALEPLLPQPQDRRSLVVLAASQAEFDQLVSPTPSPVEGRVAQASTILQVTPAEVRVQARHIVVNVQQLAQDRTGPDTFRHELSHLALAPITRPTTPGWVAEGAAMYLAGTRPVAAWAAGARDGSFSSISIDRLNRAPQLGAHRAEGGSTSAEYAYAAAAAWYLVEQFGRERFWDFYRSFSKLAANELYEVLPGGRVEADDRLGSLRRGSAEAALEAQYGLTPEELDSAVRIWLGQFL